jgi:drug/metabolite transporter (DMT)-like permease
MPFLGEITGLLTALCWSGSSIVFAAASSRVGSVQVNVSRLVMAALLLLGVILLFGLAEPLSGSQWLNLAVSGVIGLAIGDSWLFRAYTEMGPRITMLVMSLSPAIAALLSYFFLNELLTPLGILGMGVTLSGIAAVVLQRSPAGERGRVVTTAGLLYALGGALGQSVNLLFVKAAFNEGGINGFFATFVRIGAAIVVLLPLMALSGRWPNPLEAFRRDRKALLLTAIGSVLGPFLGITFSLVSVAHTSVAVASTLMSMVPILMLPLLRFVSHERLSGRAILGALVAVAGVALLFLR